MNPMGIKRNIPTVMDFVIPLVLMWKVLQRRAGVQNPQMGAEEDLFSGDWRGWSQRRHKLQRASTERTITD